MYPLTLFNFFIEFSKLSDLEKKYLSEHVRFDMGEFDIIRTNIVGENITDVEQTLIDKGWLQYRHPFNMYDEKHGIRLVVNPDLEILFRNVETWRM